MLRNGFQFFTAQKSTDLRKGELVDDDLTVTHGDGDLCLHGEREKKGRADASGVEGTVAPAFQTGTAPTTHDARSRM